jgi:hypothetical protein
MRRRSVLLCVISTHYVNNGAEYVSAIFLRTSDFLVHNATKGNRWRRRTEKLCKLGSLFRCAALALVDGQTCLYLSLRHSALSDCRMTDALPQKAVAAVRH